VNDLRRLSTCRRIVKRNFQIFTGAVAGAACPTQIPPEAPSSATKWRLHTQCNSPQQQRLRSINPRTGGPEVGGSNPLAPIVSRLFFGVCKLWCCGYNPPMVPLGMVGCRLGWQPRLRWDKTNRRWRCRWQGKHYNLGRDYTRAARRFAEIVGHEAPTAPTFTVVELANEFAANRPVWVRDWLKPWAAWAGLGMLTTIEPSHLEQYAEHLIASGYAARTVRSRVKLAAQCLRGAQRRGAIDMIPAMPRNLPSPPIVPRDIPAPLLQAAFASLPARAGAILRFVLYTGCRPSEACRLRWVDVDLRHGTCHLAVHKTAGRGHARTLYLPPHAVTLLRDVRRSGTHAFTSRLGTPYTVAGLRSILGRRGIHSVYALRHTAAQHALDSGLPIEDVAGLLGHTDLRTVSVYAQIRDSRLRRVVERLSSPLPPDTGLLAPPSAPSPSLPAQRRKAARSRKPANAKRRRGKGGSPR